jgi:hypothetical protein
MKRLRICTAWPHGLRVETAMGMAVLMGLSINKFRTKIPSDLDKPRGLSRLARDLDVRPVTPEREAKGPPAASAFCPPQRRL